MADERLSTLETRLVAASAGTTHDLGLRSCDLRCIGDRNIHSDLAENQYSNLALIVSQSDES